MILSMSSNLSNSTAKAHRSDFTQMKILIYKKPHAHRIASMKPFSNIDLLGLLKNEIL